MKLLLVEDETELSKNVAQFLENEDFVCEQVNDLDSAIDKIALYQYECIVLDISLPDGNGLALLRLLKKEKRQDGVIVISAKGSTDDKIEGLQIGADDYLAKPFHLQELRARIHAVIRRKYFEGHDEVNLGALTINMKSRTVGYIGQPIELTRMEFELLLFLVSNKNKVVSKKAIAENLFGDRADYFDNYDTVYTHLGNLKRKLQAAGLKEMIRNVYGLGYKFEAS
jgi:DNA-binding response OmpR family regulator